MVAQRKDSETSSTAKKSRKGTIAFRSIIYADWRLPHSPELGSSFQQNLAGGLAEYVVLATPGTINADPLRWKEPPHRRFVNLPVIATTQLGMEIVDPESMLAFSKRYGFLDPRLKKDEWTQTVEASASASAIRDRIDGYGPEEFGELLKACSPGLLKFAWESGDKRAVERIAEHATGRLQIHVDPRAGEIVIGVSDAWTLLCLLFVKDQAAGKTGICANPDCPAPYFLKRRKTQKICEAGDCVEWAQRNYALKWWRENKSKAARER